jgi:hypothetical protein
MTRQCQACGKAALVPDEIKPKGRKCRECIRQSRNAYNREYQKTYYPEHRAETLKRARRYRRAHRAQTTRASPRGRRRTPARRPSTSARTTPSSGSTPRRGRATSKRAG